MFAALAATLIFSSLRRQLRHSSFPPAALAATLLFSPLAATAATFHILGFCLSAASAGTVLVPVPDLVAVVVAVAVGRAMARAGVLDRFLTYNYLYLSN